MADQNKYQGRNLYRSQSNRMIGGVCGGIADYFNVDATLIRLLWVAVVFLGGIGLLVYLAALIIIPNNPEQEPVIDSETTANKLIKDKSYFWGSLLIAIGAILLLKQMGFFHMFNLFHMPWQAFWGIALLVIGAMLLYNRMKEKEAVEDGVPSDVKKLYRSKDQKMISGVCGGLAEYFEIDVSLVRILWVIATLASAGFGLLAYILVVIIFPEKPENIDQTGVSTE